MSLLYSAQFGELVDRVELREGECIELVEFEEALEEVYLKYGEMRVEIETGLRKAQVKVKQAEFDLLELQNIGKYGVVMEEAKQVYEKAQVQMSELMNVYLEALISCEAEYTQSTNEIQGQLNLFECGILSKNGRKEQRVEFVREIGWRKKEYRWAQMKEKRARIKLLGIRNLGRSNVVAILMYKIEGKKLSDARRALAPMLKCRLGRAEEGYKQAQIQTQMVLDKFVEGVMVKFVRSPAPNPPAKELEEVV